MTSKVFDNIRTFADWDQDYYPPAARKYYDRAIRRMLDHLAPATGETVLDAGCGPGVHSIRVAKLGYIVRSIDISEVAIQEARRRAAVAGVCERITFAQGDLTDLKLESNSFGAVFSWGVVIHIPEIERALKELVRIVKPGDRLALQITNHRAWDFSIERIARWMLRKPTVVLERHRLGVGGWYEHLGQRLWVWRLDIAAITYYLGELGCRRVYRSAAECTELQRRLRGPVRSILLRGNDLWFRLHMPARPAVTNILVFEKSLVPRPDCSRNIAPADKKGVVSSRTAVDVA